MSDSIKPSPLAKHYRKIGNSTHVLGSWLQALHLLFFQMREVDGHRLTEISFRFRPTSILAVIKKDSPSGPKVAFHEAETWELMWWSLALTVKRRGLIWRDDKYRKKST